MRAYWLAITLWVLNGILFISILIPTPVYIKEYNEAAKYAQQHCYSYDNIESAMLDMLFSAAFWTAVATIFIACFTGTLWWSTRGMLRATNESIRLARDEFNATHRPHLIVRDVCMDGNDIAYLLVNKGDAPAVIIESWIMAQFVQDGTILCPLRSFGHDDLGRLAFAVGQVRDLTYPIPEDLIRFSEGRRIRVVEGDLHFIGTIMYADDPKGERRRRSVFRRRWNENSRGFYSP